MGSGGPDDTDVGTDCTDKSADTDRRTQKVLAGLENDGRLVHLSTTPERLPTFARLEFDLSPRVAHLQPDEGFWAHQATAIDLARRGQSVVVATGTASGKSRCFQIPIAESMVDGLRSGTGLLLYPTKALAQDQLRALGEMDVPGLVPATYDGDADRDARTWARNNANVLLTNPEMLHYGLLPHHSKWATFFKRLRYVVIDELHVFRGIFGSHMAHVLRRLRRACARYGADPTFIFCSATIGAPEVLAADLCGKSVVPVTNDCSPQATRHVAFIQPALIDVETGRRQSPATETIRTVAAMVKSGRRVIAFCASRSLTERVAAGVIQAMPPSLADTIRPYRSGYLAAERREIEDELAAGSVRAVISTSALELGVDIGGLDVTVLCGFPGTIASLWQQIGRAGRNGEEAIAVLVAGEDQLDQWFVNHPKDLFERPPEPAVINIANPHILDPQLQCAAYEAPLSQLDDRWWLDLDEGIRRGVLADQLRIRPDRRRVPRAVWAGRGMPFHQIGLRSASGGEIKIITSDGDLIGTVERSRAANLVHPGAVYLHRGQPWNVTGLDLHGVQATVERADGDTWTQAKSATSIEVLGVDATKDVGRSLLLRGTVQVTTQITGFQRRDATTRELLETVELDLPPEELRTTAVWYQWEPDLIRLTGIRDHALPGALHAAEHAAIGILPLFTICDRWDVGGVSIAEAPDSGLPTVFVYDGYPGGAGISDLAFEAADRHLHATAEVLDTCQCTAGCPSCVQSPKCGNGNEPLDKHGALALLRTTLGFEDPF